jgi:transcriptional regulator with XRE-family HTH domain
MVTLSGARRRHKNPFDGEPGAASRDSDKSRRGRTVRLGRCGRSWRLSRAARVDEHKRAIRDSLGLGELRTRRGETQVDVAEKLGTSQTRVSSLERQDDLYLTTLGGRLEVEPAFDDETVELIPRKTAYRQRQLSPCAVDGSDRCAIQIDEQCQRFDARNEQASHLKVEHLARRAVVLGRDRVDFEIGAVDQRACHRVEDVPHGADEDAQPVAPGLVVVRSGRSVHRRLGKCQGVPEPAFARTEIARRRHIERMHCDLDHRIERVGARSAPCRLFGSTS